MLGIAFNVLSAATMAIPQSAARYHDSLSGVVAAATRPGHGFWEQN
jgi:hypothetical protein